MAFSPYLVSPFCVDQTEGPNPTCDLNYVPNTPQKRRVRVCLNNAFGFGGHNAVLVIREFEEG